MNIEHRTLNAQHRIRYSANFKKRPGKAELPFDILRFACFKIDKAQRHQYSMFDVGRSMFNVHFLNKPVRHEYTA